MDLFSNHFDFLESSLTPTDRAQEIGRQARAPLSGQRENVLRLFRDLLRRQREGRGTEFQVTQYDGRIARHLKEHGGWSPASQAAWERSGFELGTAKKRIEALQKAGMLGRDFAPTQRFEIGLLALRERLNDRSERRAGIARELHRHRAVEQYQRFAPGEQRIVGALGTFRQMTQHQARHYGVSFAELKRMKEGGFLEVHNVIIDQRPIQLYTLTKNNAKSPSGSDLAHFGAGITKPLTGIQRDHSKILHDVSVVDAVRSAEGFFKNRGYNVLGTFSEHQMYQCKASANSDLHHRYADAYLTVRSAGGSEETVAVEFGNYAPSYLKEKMAGVDADHRLVFTHDPARAEEYRSALADLPGASVEVFVIASPVQEVDR